MKQQKNALDAFNECLFSHINNYGANHPAVAYDYMTISEAMQETGNGKKVCKFFKQAINILKHTFGRNDLVLARAYNRFANFHAARKRPVQAAELYGNALAIVREAYGDYHSDTAVCLNRLVNFSQFLSYLILFN